MTETSPPAFLSDERFIKEHRRVVVMVMGRDGYSQEMSTEEFPRLRESVKLDACPRRICACGGPDPASLSTGARKWRSRRFTRRQGNMHTLAIALPSASSLSDGAFQHLPITSPIINRQR
jgi:hypothetical protein